MAACYSQPLGHSGRFVNEFMPLYFAEERLLVGREQRIRELREGPEGALYVLTNEDGDAPKGTAELLRITK